MLVRLPVHVRGFCHYLIVTRSAPIKPASIVFSSRPMTVLSRIFPFRLGYAGVRSKANLLVGSRRFSTRSVRFRPVSGSGVGRNERGEVRASKSLIEDEAELSDWVSELRSDSFRGRLTSDDEDSELHRVRSNLKGKERGRNGGRDPIPSKRRRVDSSDEVDKSWRGTRDSFQSSSRYRRLNMQGSRLEVIDGKDGGGYSPPKRGRVDQGKNARSDSRVWKKDDSNFVSKRQRDKERNQGTVSRFSGRRAPYADDERESDDALYSEEEMKVMRNGVGDLLNESGDEEEEVEADDALLKQKASSALGFDKKGNTNEKNRGPPESSHSYLSELRFDQLTLSPLSLKAVQQSGYEKMTRVQEATLPLILKGKDVLAKAKTGTGKTVAFLLPSIEVVAGMVPMNNANRPPPILVLVMSPTRELAYQVAAEADKLLKYHTVIGAQVVTGGTRLALEQKRIRANPCQILVATPGRIRDHIENTPGFAGRLKGVKVLVLDEADHLLDLGFRQDISKIIAKLPVERQTLLFSATVPEKVQQVCHVALRRDHEFIDLVDEDSEETHSQVTQMHMVAPLDKHFPLLFVLLKEHIAENVDYKVIIFCTTSMSTRLVAELLGELKLNVREIHSRKSQSYRSRVSDEFRKSKGLILVTSDVSARGVDYPDVTLVIQVGVPSDREQYIHRLGRTGRKGKEGQGILLLAPWEEFFLSAIKDLPVRKASLPSVDPEAKKEVERALCHVEMKSKESAYQSWLGYYNSESTIGKDKYRLVQLANEFSRSMGLDNPPAIPKRVVSKMGLRNIPGLRSA